LKQLITTDQRRVAKKTFQNNQEGRRNVGMRRLIWLGYVENDLRQLNLKIWNRRKIIKKNERIF
jgi:hypothetical protein